VDAILVILAALVPFAIWLFKRHAAVEADPVEQQVDRVDVYEREVIQDDEAGANVSLAADLERLRAREALHGDRSGSRGAADEDRGEPGGAV
jgi:hypothetical protein